MNTPILIDKNALARLDWLTEKPFSQVVIITDRHIEKLYGFALQKQLTEAGHRTLLFSFRPGEQSKTYKTKQNIEQAMFASQCDRQTLILALGGGVVGDLAGFIAATFLRGVPYIQIPTSLLAMVDSSIGGKTGINTPYGKNLIGAIYQPQGVVIDTALLKTLAKKQLINGLIECIKMFLTHDAEGFYNLERYLEKIVQGDEALLTELITRVVRIKANVVACDEKDNAERNTLNFGHTIGHALERLSDYTLLHGYAVGYGILVEATLSHLVGLLDSKSLNTIIHFLGRLGLHAKALKAYDVAQLIEATKLDKKNQMGRVNYVLLNNIGGVHVVGEKFVHGVEDEVVRQALHYVNAIESVARSG